MAKSLADELFRVININGIQKVVRLGDVVWWFCENQTNAKPHVATVVGICSNEMIDLEVRTHTDQPRVTLKKGVCLVGDPLLANTNNRARGSWMPRWSESECFQPTQA